MKINLSGIERMLLDKNGKTACLRATAINRKIRRHYSLSEELSILRQRDTKPEEFAEYNAFVELCKAEVDAQMEGDGI